MRRIRNSLASITVEKEKMVDLVKLYPQPRRRKIFGKRKGGKYLEKKIGEEKRSRGGRKIFRGGMSDAIIKNPGVSKSHF